MIGPCQAKFPDQATLLSDLRWAVQLDSYTGPFRFVHGKAGAGEGGGQGGTDLTLTPWQLVFNTPPFTGW